MQSLNPREVRSCPFISEVLLQERKRKICRCAERGAAHKEEKLGRQRHKLLAKKLVGKRLGGEKSRERFSQPLRNNGDRLVEAIRKEFALAIDEKQHWPKREEEVER